MLILSESTECTVRVWELRVGEWGRTELEGQKGLASCVSVSSDGMRALSGSHNGTHKVWQIWNKW